MLNYLLIRETEFICNNHCAPETRISPGQSWHDSCTACRWDWSQARSVVPFPNTTYTYTDCQAEICQHQKCVSNAKQMHAHAWISTYFQMQNAFILCYSHLTLVPKILLWMGTKTNLNGTVQCFNQILQATLWLTLSYRSYIWYDTRNGRATQPWSSNW